MTGDPVIRIDDIRKAGHCTWGARKWFRDNGLDFRDFLKNGTRASVLLAVKDNTLARQVVDRKLERENG